MASKDRVLARGPGEGKTLSVGGNKIIFKAVKEETEGAYGLLEYTAAPKFAGPPRHIHRHTEEGFYLLEGELTFRVGESTIHASAGAFVLIPRGAVHTFANPGSKPARCLVLLSPGGFEKFFEELAKVAATSGYPPPLEVRKYLSSKYDQEYV